MPERFQQEIEKILEQSEDLPPPTAARRRPKAKANRSAEPPGGRPGVITPGRVIIGAILLLLTFALVFDGTLSTVLLWGCLGLGVLGYALFFVRADRADAKLHWRGKPVEYAAAPPSGSWWDRLTHRFRR